jgi:hypothetical protein
MIDALRTRPALQAGLVALLVGALVQWWMQRADLVLAFWDAQAHLDIARRVWDSTTPGIQMLGTVWLPVPHLLYLPFTLVDQWWWNGLAGGLVALAAFGATAMAAFAIVHRHTGSTRWGWLTAAIVIANPSLAYLQTTAMTEPILLAFLTGSVWALDRWHGDRDRGGHLLLSGVLAALAVGSRYDGWFYAAIAALLVLVHSRRAGPTLRFAAPVAVMVGLWLAYNAIYFGDPLEFQRGIWSAESQQAALAASGLLPTKGAPLISLGYYAGATALTVGVILAPLGLLGAALALGSPGRWALLLLWTALPFNLLALWGGQSVIALPWTTPEGMLNVRYGVMLIPAIAVSIGLGGAMIGRFGPRWHRGTFFALLALIGGQSAWMIADAPVRVGALREGLAIRDGDAAQMNASRWLAAHYDRGRILVAPAVNLSPRSRISLRDRIYPWTWELGPRALAAPAETVDWVLVDRRAATDEVARALAVDHDFEKQFDRVFEERELEIWRRR